MKYLFLIVLLCSLIHPTWSQKKEAKPFRFQAEKLEKVFKEIENKFDIKYSYVDSIAVGKYISLSKDIYSLEQLNEKITEQTSLKIVKIDNRFYAVVQEPTSVPDKIYELQDVLVEGFLANGINKTSQKVILYPQKIQTLPGVTDADILLALQQLPGVKSPNETASGLNVRGSTSDQNLILWDGIRLYHPGHLFGMISAINPNVEQTVNYSNKATNPKFGERISSVVDIKTTDKISEVTKINIGLNAINADGYIQIPLVKNKVALQLSGRKSITEWWMSPTFNQLAKKVFQNTNFNDLNNQNKFQFQDYSSKLIYKPTTSSTVSLSTLWIDNNLNFNRKTENNTDNSQKMSISNYGLSLNWKQKWNHKWEQNTLVFYSAYDFKYQKFQEYSFANWDGYKKVNRIVDSGAELNTTFSFNDKIKAEFGYQLFGNDISHLFNSYNQDISVVLDIKHNYNITHVGYASLKYDYQKWNAQVGARYNYFNLLKTVTLEPRIRVQRTLLEQLIWQMSFEEKSQIASQIREDFANDLSLENYVWVIANNKEYPLQKANQYTSGFIYKYKSWLLDVDAYYKTIHGITSFTFDFQNQYDSNFHEGKGFTKGVDVLLQKSAPSWRAWMTYTYQDSQNKFEGVNQNQNFQINTNSKHSLNFSLYKKWQNYTLAMGWFWHTGKPYSALSDEGQIQKYNAQTLPNYHRLDISGFYQFQDTKMHTYKIGFSIYNLYNHQEIISKELERKYNTITDYNTPRYAIQDYYALGITPNLFLRIAL